MKKISIKKLLLLIAICALWCASLGAASDVAYRWAHTTTLVALLTATLAALLDAPPRGAWLGFALFGWGHFLSTHVPAIEKISWDYYISVPLRGRLIDTLQHWPPVPPHVSADEIRRATVDDADPVFAAYARARVSAGERGVIMENTADLLLCWLVGLAGATLGRRIGDLKRPDAPAPTPPG